VDTSDFNITMAGLDVEVTRNADGPVRQVFRFYPKTHRLCSGGLSLIL
jgi:hypothetical protein